VRSPRDPRPPRARSASRINSNGRGAGVRSRETTPGTLPRARRFPGSQVVVRREPSHVAFISIAGRISIQRKVDMRAHRMFLSLAIAIGCGITLQSAAISQEYRGTWQQQQACTPDVWRLCGGQIPDVNRIVACLRRNTPQLSDQCRAVFAQGDTAPPRGEYREYERRDRDYGPRRYDRDYGPRPSDRDYGPRPYYDDE
jgi:hypothetical protein